MGKLPKIFHPVRQLFSNGASRVKVLKILVIIAVILMVVSVVHWFVLFKERKELEGLGGKHPAASEEEVDLEEVRRIFEEEGYMEEGEYSPSPDEEYPALPLGKQKEGVALGKGKLLGNLAESLVRFFSPQVGKVYEKLFGGEGISVTAQSDPCPICQKVSESPPSGYKIITDATLVGADCDDSNAALNPGACPGGCYGGICWNGVCLEYVGDQTCPAEYPTKHTREVCTACSSCTGGVTGGGASCSIQCRGDYNRGVSCSGQGCTNCVAFSGDYGTGNVCATNNAGSATACTGSPTSCTTYTYCCQ